MNLNITCSSCSAENPPHYRFCSSCGADLNTPGACPRCAAPAQTSQKFCGVCGLDLAPFARQVSRRPLRPSTSLPDVASSENIAAPVPSTIRILPALRRVCGNVNERLERVQNTFSITAEDAVRIPLPIEIAIVCVLTLIAFFLRVSDIMDNYPGIYQDEVRSMWLIQRILSEGWIGFFSDINRGMGTLTHYMAVPYFLVGGSGLEMWRLSIAMSGVALVPIAHLLVRHLFNARIALLTAAMLTFCVWFVMQSRIGWDVVPSVLFYVAGLYLLFLGISSRRISVAALAGLVFAAGIYTNKAFLFYYVGVMTIAFGTILVNPAMRRRAELYAFLITSFVVGFAMVRHYLFSDYSLTDITAVYGLRLSDIPYKLSEHVQDAWNLFLLVHNPMPAEQTDGAGGIPILRPFIAEIFFWIGLATTLMYIKKSSCQFLLLGWLISTPAAILFPDGEARRYILGIFHILVIVAIGFDVLLISLVGRASNIIKTEMPIFRRFAAWIPVSASVVVMLAFAAFFALENRSHFNDWMHGRSARWYFDYELVSAGKYLQTLRDSQSDDYQVRMYSIRWRIDFIVLKYLLPDLQGVNGGEEFGGDGTALSGGELKGDTVFLLLDKYLEQNGLAEDIEASYPGGDWHRQVDEDGKPLFAAYVIDSQ